MTVDSIFVLSKMLFSSRSDKSGFSVLCNNVSMMSGILPPPGGGGGAPPTTQASTPSETPNDNQGIKTEAEIELTPVTQVLSHVL